MVLSFGQSGLWFWVSANLGYGFEFRPIWVMVLSFVFRPIWVWIQIFWVLNFVFIFSKSMTEDPWPKPHGWRSMAKIHLDGDLIFSLSKPRSVVEPNANDGHRGMIWPAHDCVLVYFIDEDWLWVLVFLVFCFWSNRVLGLCLFYYYYFFWLSVLGFVSWLC